MTTAEMLHHVETMQANENADPVTKLGLAKLAEELTAKVRADAARSRGVGSAAVVLEKMFKNADTNRPGTTGAWIDDHGRQCACDGFQAYRLREPIPLTEIPKGVTPIELHRVYELVERRENVLINDVPTVQALKERAAVERAKNGRKAPVMVDLGRGFPTVNAQYLLNLYAVLPGAKLYAAKTCGRMQAVYAVSERGDALILPMRTKEKQTADELQKQARSVLDCASQKDASGEPATVRLSDLALLVNAARVAV